MMYSAGDVDMNPKHRASLKIGVGVTLFLLVVLLANAHLVYVSFKSQPECVTHIKPSERPAAPGTFSAAQSAC